MYENNLDELIYGQVLRETRNLALVRVDFTNGALTAYFIIEKENHIEEEYHRIYDKFFDGVFGVGMTPDQAFTGAYNDRYAMRDKEIYEEIEELENEQNQNEMGNVVYGKSAWETKNLVLVVMRLNEAVKLYLIVEKPNSIMYGGIAAAGNTEYRAFVSAYNNISYTWDRELYEEVEELEKMAFGW